MIGGFRSDLSIIRMTDGNFGNVSAGVLFSKAFWLFEFFLRPDTLSIVLS